MRQTIVSMAIVAIGYFCALPGSASRAADEEQKPVLSNEQIQQALQAPVTRSFTPRGLARRQASDSGQSVNLNIPRIDLWSPDIRTPKAARNTTSSYR
jgi:hypothetical protein